jgi:hypothetical protein
MVGVLEYASGAPFRILSPRRVTHRGTRIIRMRLENELETGEFCDKTIMYGIYRINM